MYASGQGTEADDAQAVFWYQKAVVKGHAVAECNLGNCYHDGRGVAKDLAVAFKW
jgi:TPR repeat protein